MTRAEVLQRFCALATKVGNVKFESREAHDCFCGANSRRDWVNGFQFDEPVMTFIETAVAQALGEKP